MAVMASRAGSKLAAVINVAMIQAQLVARMPRREYSGVESFFGSRRRRLDFLRVLAVFLEAAEVLRALGFLRSSGRSVRRTFAAGR